jgi:hypothetical protein
MEDRDRLRSGHVFAHLTPPQVRGGSDSMRDAALESRPRAQMNRLRTQTVFLAERGP